MEQFNGNEVNINGIQIGKYAYYVVEKREYIDCKECRGKGMVNTNYKNRNLNTYCPLCNGGRKLEETTYIIHEVIITKIVISKDKLSVYFGLGYNPSIVGDSVFANKKDAEEHATHLNDNSRTKS